MFNFREAALKNSYVKALPHKVYDLSVGSLPPIFQELKSQYTSLDHSSSILEVAALSLLNSCLTQERRVILLGREACLKLLSTDVNIPANVKKSFHNRQWTKILNFLTEDIRIIKLVARGEERHYNTYEVTYAPVIEYLNSVDYDLQLNECLKFSGVKKE